MTEVPKRRGGHPGPRRPAVTMRMSKAGLDLLAARAIEEGLTIRNGEPNRSEIARIFIAYAAQHMPKGWRPRKPKGQDQ